MATLLATLATSASAQEATAYVGSEACGACHQAEIAAWSASDHWWALQPASEATVRGDFANAQLDHFGVTSRFFRQDGRFMVETEGPGGEPGTFEVVLTVGIDPLQQYLVETEPGRLQTLPLAWDTRPAAAGGQRWFPLYPDERIGADDPLHWTKLAYNWNASCAACHSTDLRKNYDLESDRFATSWAEIDVGCEACHGPGSAHVAWATAEPDAAKRPPNLGLTTALGAEPEGAWALAPDAAIASWSGPPRARPELDVCAACHARRRAIVDAAPPGTPFLDAFAPALLDERLYYPDGQIDDEVYVWGSFQQSRMFRAGVTCSDCHRPHDLELRAEGNAVCAQCHRASVFDAASHYRHQPGSAGASCVACHMPAKTYMVVDPRRDHSFRVPRPDLSLELGVPNACTQCHTDRDADWAAAQVVEWYGEGRRAEPHFGTALAAGREGRVDAGRQLARLVTDADQPAIARATALTLLPDYLGPGVIEAYRQGLSDPEPLVRLGAVRALEPFAPAQRLAAAAPLLSDPVRAVRIEAARLLAGAPTDQLPVETWRALRRATQEFVEAQKASAERPESHLNLGVLDSQRGRLSDAERAYRQALALDPTFTPAAVNLADLLSGRRREGAAEDVLRQALETTPDAAAAHHALGLLLVRTDRLDLALPELRQAAELEPDTTRFGYVLGVALNAAGDAEAAVQVLDQLHQRRPADRDVLLALATINRDRGARDQALDYAKRLQALAPDDANVRALVRELGGR